MRELGDASVPFQFDVHAVIYSEDAPALENALHRAFNDRRVNRVNERKEFFRVGTFFRRPSRAGGALRPAVEAGSAGEDDNDVC